LPLGRTLMARRRSLVAFAAAVAAIGIAVSLGQWQLRRADEKLALQAAWDRAEQAAPLPVSGSDLASVAERLPLRVLLRGRFLFSHEVWLDSRQMDGQAGLMLLTPLRLADGAVVLVNRGFARRDPGDRARLPQVARPEGELAVEGLALAQAARVLPLGEDAPTAGGPPFVWQNLDYEAFERASGLAVARWIVQQTGGADDGLRRNWPRLGTGVDKHRGYAAQWFALATLVAALTAFFGLRLLRGRSTTSRSDD
jgi:surfeit locus 1 family protein